VAFTTKQLASYVQGSLVGDDHVQCEGASIDSRQCMLGNVFFALGGDNVDGHQFIEAAISAGCSAVVVEKEISASVPVVQVKNVRKALFDLATHRRKRLQVKKVIAVTGSVGKTTTKDMIALMLGPTATKSKKSFNNDLGVPLTILDAEGAEYLVAEVGANEIGEIAPLATLVQPDIGILTTIGHAHLEGFGDYKTILAEKAKLLESVTSDGVAIVPLEIDLGGFEISASVCTLGSTSNADVQIETGVDASGHSTLRIDGIDCTLSMLGEHNAKNAAVAITACRHANPEFGVTLLLERLQGFQGAEGRLQRTEVDGITFIDDSYNANPASMKSALEFFKSIPCSRKILILGDMLELGEHAHAEHRLLSSSIESVGADVVILVGEEMKSASQTVTSIYEKEATIDALNRIVSMLQPDDTVLLKGSRGMQLERVIELKRQTKVSSQ